MQKKKGIFIVLIMLVLMLSLTTGVISCEDKAKITRLNGSWNITIIDDIRLNSGDLEKNLPLIRFDTANGTISGNTGCNSFSGSARYTDDTIEVRDLMTTLMACPDMDIEERLLKIFNNQIVTFNIDGDTITITNDSGGTLTLIKIISS